VRRHSPNYIESGLLGDLFHNGTHESKDGYTKSVIAILCRFGLQQNHYDIFLSHLSTDTVLVGVGYDFQLAEVVPVSRKDKPVNYVITPTEGILKAKRD
jgi:hypothetical protein